MQRLVESINENNYGYFRQNERAVLVIGLDICPHCQRYNPIVESLAETLHKVRFGQVTIGIDDPSAEELIDREFGAIFDDEYAGYPTTIVLKTGQNPIYFAGAYAKEDALDMINFAFDPRKVDPEGLVATLYELVPADAQQPKIDTPIAFPARIPTISLSQLMELNKQYSEEASVE